MVYSRHMISIVSVELREIHMSLKEPFITSAGFSKHKRVLLLKLKDKSGLTQWSECVAGDSPSYTPETIDTAWHILKTFLIPILLSKSFNTAEAFHHAVASSIRGHQMAKASLEMALYALQAQQKGCSLAQFIGGTQKALKSGLAIGLQTNPKALLEKVSAALDLGYHKIKIKVMPGKDTAYFYLLRKELGHTFPLMADANSAYTLADTPHIKTFDDFNLMMIEQPLSWDDIYQHQFLQKEIKTPLCLDESISSLNHAKEMHALKSAQIINVKPGRVGGFYESLRIHDFAKKNKIPLWCGGMLETGIGKAYNIALSSLAGFSLTGDLAPSSRYWEEDIVNPVWELTGKGMIQVPFNKVGLGITINEPLIERLTSVSYSTTAN